MTPQLARYLAQGTGCGLGRPGPRDPMRLHVWPGHLLHGAGLHPSPSLTAGKAGTRSSGDPVKNL